MKIEFDTEDLSVEEALLILKAFQGKIEIVLSDDENRFYGAIDFRKWNLPCDGEDRMVIRGELQQFDVVSYFENRVKELMKK